MVSVSLIKIKLLTILSMVFMGLFSRIVLGLPLIFPISTPTFHIVPQETPFPTNGARTSLRFLPAPRYGQKRRRMQKNGSVGDEEITIFSSKYFDSDFDFIGEVIESEEGSMSDFRYIKP